MEVMNVETWKGILDKMLDETLSKTYIDTIKDQRGKTKGVKRSAVLGSKKSDKATGSGKHEMFDKDVVINIIDKHAFIEERTKITKSYVIHKYLYGEDIPSSYQSKTFVNGRGWRTDNRDKNFMMSGDLVRLMLCIDAVFRQVKTMTSYEFDACNDFERLNCWCINYEGKDYKLDEGCNYSPDAHCFTPMDWNTYGMMETRFHRELKDDELTDLNYSKEHCTRLMTYKTPYEDKTLSKVETTYWYADFEADVTGEVHKPFMVCVQPDSGVKSRTATFRGENCAQKLLDYLPNGAVVYFHNLRYDFSMIKDHGSIMSILKKGNKIMNAKINYHNKTIRFRDTLVMLNCKLSAIPSMFHLDVNVKKEIFPYKYYTLDKLKENRGVISECGLNEDKEWTTEDKETFIKNIDSIRGCRLSDNEFDMYKYAEFYCQQDVTILRLGFEKFCEDFYYEFEIQPKEFVSISALANEVFRQRVYVPNGNLYEYGGIVQKFIQKAVHGGRCMCAFNKKWKLDLKLTDYDAVSLYPSAMSRLYTVEGTPEVFKFIDKATGSDNHEMIDNNVIHKSIPEFLSNKTAYVVEIKITKVNKHYAFPLIVQKKDGLNLNDDNIQEDVNMFVDDIYLEDLVKFQKIEFKVIRGYYWTGKKDYTIQEEIRRIFNKRVEYKNEIQPDGSKGNPLQTLYKLIMNSCYGKCIQKPVEYDLKFKHGKEEIEKYASKNYDYIDEEISVNDNTSMFKVCKSLDKSFSNTLLGVHILSMSKRIMNEVMCLAYDLKCHIYYQDTDSFMIEIDDLPRLEEAYESLYHRKLRGTDLGCFHPDFEPINGEVPISVQSVFLMKKMYVHKLMNSKGEVDYHLRGKGLTQQSIKHNCMIDNVYDPIAFYTKMYEGSEEVFDLTIGQPCFSMNKDLTVSTNEEFKRRVSCKYEEGVRDKYFN